ncbi:voltage-dependent calcium channel gamma-5 subunit isoform X3 [Symphalangus syndactylus]|uniref:voltage-dependent calcium channel gamma-5 subunit isoform X3 n=1 Tax=Symphalangus syndactylus TaxID=9590 RepID=UPI003004E367
MSACGRKALTLLSSVFAVCGLGLLGIAVSTDYWLYLEEGVIVPQNQSTEIKMSLHSGLWRVCFLAGEERGRCFTIEYVMPMNTQLTSESTVNVLKMIRSATPFPLVSLFFMFIGFILSNIGHIRPHRTILAFVSGIFFILSGKLQIFLTVVSQWWNLTTLLFWRNWSNWRKTHDTSLAMEHVWSVWLGVI